MSEALSFNTALERLEMSNNGLGDDGGSYLAAAMRENGRLKVRRGCGIQGPRYPPGGQRGGERSDAGSVHGTRSST